MLQKFKKNYLLSFVNTFDKIFPTKWQFGFIPQKLLTLNYTNWRTLLKHVLLDIKGTFDHAWRPSIFQALHDRSCFQNIYLLRQSCFYQRKSHIADHWRQGDQKMAKQRYTSGLMLLPSSVKHNKGWYIQDGQIGWSSSHFIWRWNPNTF